MSEKLSEQHLRVEKVEALKARLLGEISSAVDQALFELRCLTVQQVSSNPWFVRYSINKMHNLYALEDYLKNDGLFMDFVMADASQDIVIYKINGDTLDWMMQNKNLLSDILFHIAKFGAPAEIVLDDEFFELQVFTVLEKALWSQRTEATKGKTVDDLIEVATQRSCEVAQDGIKNRDQELGVGI